MRGLVIDPLEIFELLRDTYSNLPIPKDARFEGVGVEKKGADSYIQFIYSTDMAGSREKIIVKPTDIYLNPMSHSVVLKPQLFLDILKYWFDGKVPSDAEAKAVYINRHFNYICLEAASDKFPSTDTGAYLTMPLIHLSYDGSEVHTFDGTTRQESRILV